MKRTVVAFTVVIIATLTGCATVKYKKAFEESNKKGVHYFLSRPYLLVTRSIGPQGNPTISTQLVSLPDRSERFRASWYPRFRQDLPELDARERRCSQVDDSHDREWGYSGRASRGTGNGSGRTSRYRSDEGDGGLN